jgi:hypothetical protein
MSNGKSYTENLVEIHQKLSSLETISTYQENHLSNIDQHLNKLNERTIKNERQTAKNTSNIGWICKIGGGIVGSGGLVFLIIKLVEVFT